MPYEKVCLMVAAVVCIVLGTMLSSNISNDAKVAVIDLDNSAYSHELTSRIDASEYMKVTTVLNTPVDPTTLFYRDQAVAVVYFPRGLEKDHYTGARISRSRSMSSSASTMRRHRVTRAARTTA